MKTLAHYAFATLAAAVLPVMASASQLAIEAFDSSGRLTFSIVSNASVYVVEFATVPSGGQWLPAAALLAGQENEVTIECTNDPARFFRVVAGVTNPASPPPEDMALIPAGDFQMGDCFDEGIDWEQPTHTIFVGSYYMDQHPVTKALWDEVRDWAITNGYSDLPEAVGKGPDHPVHWVTWYDAVKWCNARSEMEGRTPAYYTTFQRKPEHIYRTNMVDVSIEWVRWDTGYRLPTEAEWEKAARGGYSGRRFPWGNTISHDQANFKNDGGEDYATGPSGFHPDHYDEQWPFTNPVGVFPANGYGLHDFAGNVREWCWNWDGMYSCCYFNPLGPFSGTHRMTRGGSYDGAAFWSRVAARSCQEPGFAYIYLGFRTVLPLDAHGFNAHIE